MDAKQESIKLLQKAFSLDEDTYLPSRPGKVTIIIKPHEEKFTLATEKDGNKVPPYSSLDAVYNALVKAYEVDEEDEPAETLLEYLRFAVD